MTWGHGQEPDTAAKRPLPLGPGRKAARAHPDCSAGRGPCKVAASGAVTWGACPTPPHLWRFVPGPLHTRTAHHPRPSSFRSVTPREGRGLGPRSRAAGSRSGPQTGPSGRAEKLALDVSHGVRLGRAHRRHRRLCVLLSVSPVTFWASALRGWTSWGAALKLSC